MIINKVSPLKMHREHNILVRKHLNVSFPATVKLLKVLPHFLPLSVALSYFFAEDLTPLAGGGKCVENSFASFPEMLCSS